MRQSDHHDFDLASGELDVWRRHLKLAERIPRERAIYAFAFSLMLFTGLLCICSLSGSASKLVGLFLTFTSGCFVIAVARNERNDRQAESEVQKLRFKMPSGIGIDADITMISTVIRQISGVPSAAHTEIIISLFPTIAEAAQKSVDLLVESNGKMLRKGRHGNQTKHSTGLASALEPRMYSASHSNLFIVAVSLVTEGAYTAVMLPYRMFWRAN